MKTKGPPRARKRYPGMYASKGSCIAKAMRRAPMVRSMLPMMPLTRGPYLSRIVPTGRAQTLVATAAVVNMKLSLARFHHQQSSQASPNRKSLPYLLFVACPSYCSIHELLFLTELTVYPLLNQDRLYRCISKYDPRCEEAIDNSDSDLDCNPNSSATSDTS